MNKYLEHFRMSAADAVEYTKYFGIFPDDAELRGEEIGDGNINYIFRVIEDKTGKSVVLKQADKFLRSSGRPLDLDRSRIEAEILKLEGNMLLNLCQKYIVMTISCV